MKILIPTIFLFLISQSVFASCPNAEQQARFAAMSQGGFLYPQQQHYFQLQCQQEAIQRMNSYNMGYPPSSAPNANLQAQSQSYHKYEICPEGLLRGQRVHRDECLAGQAIGWLKDLVMDNDR